MVAEIGRDQVRSVGTGMSMTLGSCIVGASGELDHKFQKDWWLYQRIKAENPTERRSIE